MQGANGGNIPEFFTGRVADALSAQDAVHAIPYTRYWRLLFLEVFERTNIGL
jgi:hypothetical protein